MQCEYFKLVSKNMLKLKVKRIRKDIILPEYKTEGASGFDLSSSIDSLLKAGEFAVIPTGLIIEVPPGYEAQVRPRSGLAASNGIGVLNTPGTIDSDYRGEIKIVLFNFSDKDFNIRKGDRIAQLVISKIERVKIIEVENISGSERGTQGFGSTGI